MVAGWQARVALATSRPEPPRALALPPPQTQLQAAEQRAAEAAGAAEAAAAEASSLRTQLATAKQGQVRWWDRGRRLRGAGGCRAVCPAIDSQ